MNLYSFNGSEPKPLPNRIVLPDGQTRTDNSTFSELELASAGYVLWDGVVPSFQYYQDRIWENGQYTIRDWDITSLANHKKSQFESMYNDKIYADIEYGGNIFQADRDSQKLLFEVLSFGEVPAGFFWQSKDNGQIPMTIVEIREFAGAVLLRRQLEFINHQTVKTSINNAGSTAELLTVAWAADPNDAAAV